MDTNGHRLYEVRKELRKFKYSGTANVLRFVLPVILALGSILFIIGHGTSIIMCALMSLAVTYGFAISFGVLIAKRYREFNELLDEEDVIVYEINRKKEMKETKSELLDNNIKKTSSITPIDRTYEETLNKTYTKKKTR